MNFLMIDGAGDPNVSLEYQQAMEALFSTYREGLSAQIMHIGPYAAEEPTIARLHSFIRDNGYELNGKHHEIYLSDPRRTAPEKLKTVLRQPIRKRSVRA